MNENISKAIDYAFSNNINEMGKEIEGALMQKVADALAGKRIEVAQTLIAPEGVSESSEEPFEDKGDDEDLEEVDESYIEEKLSVSDGAEAWIKDFVNSDDPRFEGKSKKERIQMALGAYYSAKKGKTRNEEVEELDELSTDTMQSFVDKKQQIIGKKRDSGVSLAKKKIAKIESDKKKYINARKW